MSPDVLNDSAGLGMDGTFEWGRRTGKRVSIYVQTPDGSVRLNVVRIAGL